jgi:hypothetical protein
MQSIAHFELGIFAMLSRRKFVKGMIAGPALASVNISLAIADQVHYNQPEFYKDLQPVGRRLEIENHYVWCNTPIDGPDGKVHVFFSQWRSEKKMGGWLNGCEIGHAIADSAESEFQIVGTVLAPRGPGFWDGTTCHNPHIQFIDNKYCLFYMGNSNGKTDTKRIGLATSDSLFGPWKRPDAPLLLPGDAGAWDDHCTTNPAFVKHNGQYWLYYKSWNTSEYINASGPIRGNRKYGVAIANALEGPYKKHERNPVIDFSSKGNNRQFEDAFVWKENNKFNMLARDMGIFSHKAGLYLESHDGLQWSEPVMAYQELKVYAQEPQAPEYLKRYGRLERPQLLIRNGKPAYLFTASQGGKYMTSSAFVLKINS